MTTSFDPYHVWLGIPPELQPPDFYRLLGIQTSENDPNVIEHAADRQMAHVRTFQNGRHTDACQRLLNEIAAARICLLDPVAKSAYDEKLQSRVPPAEPPIIIDPVPTITSLREPARRQTASAAGVAMKVVLGGLAGIAGGALLLHYLGGIELFDNGPEREWVPSDTRVVTGIDKTGAEISSSGVTSVATKTDDPIPTAHAVDHQPAVKTELPIGETAESKANSDEPNAARQFEVFSAEVNEPVGAVDPPAPAKQAKLPVPSAERQAAVRKQLDELYPLATTKLAADKLKLAEEMRKIARNSASAPDERFGLLRRASELAADAADLALALSIVDELAAEYDFDLLTAKQATVTRFAAATASEPAVEAAFKAATLLVAAAHRQSRYDQALQIADTLLDFCQKPAGSKLRKQAVEIRNDARRLHEQWLAYRAAMTTLVTTPNDSTACLTAGRWLTLHQNDWAAGLALLAKGESKSLAEAAKQDLATMLGGDAMLACGDRWYEVAMAIETDRAFLARAAHWYRQALPQLTGLAKIRAERRLAEVEVSAPGQPSVASGGAPNWGEVTRWIGVAVHTEGPEVGTTYQRVELIVDHQSRSDFSSKYTWAAYGEKELGRGQYDIKGAVKNGTITWECKENGAKGRGSVRDGVLFVAWEQPPYGGENWYVPLPGQDRANSSLAGRYQITEMGRPTLQFDLHPDGTAAKGSTTVVKGAWLGANDRALIAWADGWRDVLAKDKAGWRRESYRPGSSYSDRPMKIGVAKKVD